MWAGYACWDSKRGASTIGDKTRGQPQKFAHLKDQGGLLVEAAAGHASVAYIQGQKRWHSQGTGQGEVLRGQHIKRAQ